MTDQPPLNGVRVLEYTRGLAGRTAGGLLADLGAEVVQLPAGGDAPDRSDAARVWSDRRKVIRGIGSTDRERLAELRRLLDCADVFLTDLTPGALERAGLDAVAVREQNPAIVHGWLPPFGVRGRWSHLDADPLLLAAVGGYAGHYPAASDRPVAPVVPTFLYLHGAMAAAAVVAGLVGREVRGSGHAVRVSGLDAMGAALGTLMMQGLGTQELAAAGRSTKGPPYFRLYRGSDQAWFYLAALSPAIFVRALDAVGRLDLLVREDVAGEFANLLVPEVREQVNAELEGTFAARTAREWLAVLRAADVPAAPVWTRAQWLDAQVVDAARRTRFDHPDFGPLTVPAPPISLSRTPMLSGGSPLPGPSAWWASPAPPLLSAGSRPPGLSAGWESPAPPWAGSAACPPNAPASPNAPAAPAGAPAAKPALPLDGIRVVDLCSFLAGPFAAALLADFGADVVKVEPTDGDPYRVFAVSHAVVNQDKRVAALDLGDPGARAGFVTLLEGADVLVDNFLPDSLERLGLGPDMLAKVSPGLIRCSVSAFGTGNDWSGTPGFDPVLQSMTGLAVAQGGTDSPVPSSAPVVDTATGALGALGTLAALYARCRSGAAQHVRTSLAAGAVFVQSGEMTSYAGCPPPPPGELDFLGASPTRRFYATADGWLAVAASSDRERAALLRAVGHPEWQALSEAEIAAALEGELAAGPSEYWLDEFSAAGVPAAGVLPRERGIADPYLTANGFSHVIEVPGLGEFRIVRSYSAWEGVTRRPGSSPVVGRDTVEVLSEAGVGTHVIDDLLARKVAAYQ
jgi:crotonobetainyl-CoA:carnitine CoA-transferase CaiB-like acyl-CoA transferase